MGAVIALLAGDFRQISIWRFWKRYIAGVCAPSKVKVMPEEFHSSRPKIQIRPMVSKEWISQCVENTTNMLFQPKFKINDILKYGTNRIESTDCNKFCVDQTRNNHETLIKHLNAKTTNIKSNLAIYTINTGQGFAYINNVTLFKCLPHKGNIMIIMENVHIYYQKANNTSISK